MSYTPPPPPRVVVVPPAAPLPAATVAPSTTAATVAPSTTAPPASSVVSTRDNHLDMFYKSIYGDNIGGYEKLFHELLYASGKLDNVRILTNKENYTAGNEDTFKKFIDNWGVYLAGTAYTIPIAAYGNMKTNFESDPSLIGFVEFFKNFALDVTGSYYSVDIGAILTTLSTLKFQDGSSVKDYINTIITNVKAGKSHPTHTISVASIFNDKFYEEYSKLPHRKVKSVYGSDGGLYFRKNGELYTKDSAGVDTLVKLNAQQTCNMANVSGAEACADFMHCFLVGNDSSLAECVSLLGNAVNFFGSLKDDLNKDTPTIDVKSMLAFLKKFKFPTYKDNGINKIIPYSQWEQQDHPSTKLEPAVYNLVKSNTNLVELLKAMITYINSYPAILNAGQPAARYSCSVEDAKSSNDSRSDMLKSLVQKYVEPKINMSPSAILDALSCKNTPFYQVLSQTGSGNQTRILPENVIEVPAGMPGGYLSMLNEGDLLYDDDEDDDDELGNQSGGNPSQCPLAPLTQEQKDENCSLPCFLQAKKLYQTLSTEAESNCTELSQSLKDEIKDKLTKLQVAESRLQELLLLMRRYNDKRATLAEACPCDNDNKTQLDENELRHHVQLNEAFTNFNSMGSDINQQYYQTLGAVDRRNQALMPMFQQMATAIVQTKNYVPINSELFR